MLKNQEGKILPVVLAFSIIAQLLGGFLLSQVVANRQLAEYHEAHMYSDYITEAALQWALNAFYESADTAIEESYYTFDEIVYPDSSIYDGFFIIEFSPMDDNHISIKVNSTMNMPSIEFDIHNGIVAKVEKATYRITSKKWVAF